MASAPPSSDDALASVRVSSFETTVEGFVVYHIDYTRVSGQILSAQRRYNDVAAFWDDLSAAHPELPELQTFRFPRKSIFNTHSHFTKERRRAGFEELFKLLLEVGLERPLRAFLDGEPAAAPRKSAAARRAPRPRAPVWDHAPRDRSSEPHMLGLVDIFVALTAALGALVGVGLVSIRTMSLARVLALDCAASGLVWAAMNRARAANPAVT